MTLQTARVHIWTCIYGNNLSYLLITPFSQNRTFRSYIYPHAGLSRVLL